MEKLTREQADWLIEKVMDNVRTGEFADVVYADEIENIINQCTEKEFPSIHMRPKHAEDTEEVKVYTGWCDGSNGNCIILFSLEEYTHFNKEQFKQFTAGCQKICQMAPGKQEILDKAKM